MTTITCGAASPEDFWNDFLQGAIRLLDSGRCQQGSRILPVVSAGLGSRILAGVPEGPRRLRRLLAGSRCGPGAGLPFRTLVCVTRLSEAELDAMVQEATVDCYGEEEQLTGLATMVGENLEVPFETTVLGVTVTVTGVTHTSHGLVADCARGRHRQPVHLLDLPLPDPPPNGAEWIAAYRRWAR